MNKQRRQRQAELPASIVNGDDRLRHVANGDSPDEEASPKEVVVLRKRNSRERNASASRTRPLSSCFGVITNTHSHMTI